jgi:hypothetical protein
VSTALKKTIVKIIKLDFSMFFHENLKLFVCSISLT